MTTGKSPAMPINLDTEDEANFSDPGGDDFAALSRDRVAIRSLEARDLPALITLDRRLTGHARGDYYAQKVDEALNVSGVRVSLVAEDDAGVTGFIMARVDYGEFGQTEPQAVIDTIGVDPAHRGKQVGTALLSQLLANLRALRVDSVRTELSWDQFALMAFLARHDFRPSQRLALRRALG